VSKPEADKPATKPKETSSAIVVTTTTRTMEQAEFIAEVLVRGRLAACVQMAPITTKYLWQGEVAFHEEVMVTIKTLQTFYPKVQAAILKNSTYELPEVIATPVVGCSKAYFDWIVTQVTE